MLQRDARRFYKKVETREGPAGWQVLLDGRLLRTPAKTSFFLPSGALAAAIAEEWEAQEKKLDASSMPLTSLAFSALDLVKPQREQVVEELSDYAGTDLLCYRAAHPAALVERQHATWQPLLDWASLSLDAPLSVTEGIAALEQPAASLAALRRAVESHEDFALTALALAVRTSGSLVIGLAMSHGRLDATAAFEAAELEQTYELEVWGADAEAEVRRQDLLEELALCERFLSLLREG